jgi:hypothetical protein
MNRRTFCITLIAASSAGRSSAQNCDRGLWCAGSVGLQREPMSPGGVNERNQAAPQPDANLGRQYTAIYGQIDNEPFPIRAVKLSDIDPAFLRQQVNYPPRAEPGTIVVDPHTTSCTCRRRTERRSATASGSDARASLGPVSRRSTTSGNGRTGIRQGRCYGDSPSSWNG